MKPELALRLLDTLDGMAYALRLACAGYWGGRLRVVCIATGVACSALIAPLPLF